MSECFRSKRLSILSEDGHQCLHLDGVSPPVLGGESIYSHYLHPILLAPLDEVHQCLTSRPVPLVVIVKWRMMIKSSDVEMEEDDEE